jgi:hypothetical protein
MDKSVQGPRRAVAKAVAHPLGINQAYSTLENPPPKGQLLGYDAAIKATPSAQCANVDGGGLPKAVQELL